jgi:hypothetical protein
MSGKVETGLVEKGKILEEIKMVTIKDLMVILTFEKHPVETGEMEERCEHPDDAGDVDENSR